MSALAELLAWTTEGRSLLDREPHMGTFGKVSTIRTMAEMTRKEAWEEPLDVSCAPYRHPPGRSPEPLSSPSPPERTGQAQGGRHVELHSPPRLRPFGRGRRASTRQQHGSIHHR